MGDNGAQIEYITPAYNPSFYHEAINQPPSLFSSRAGMFRQVGLTLVLLLHGDWRQPGRAEAPVGNLLKVRNKSVGVVVSGGV